MFRLIIATRDAFSHEVVSLHGEGVYASQLRSAGIPATSLGMSRGRVSLQGMRELRRIMRRCRPDVVQTRLDHANLLGGLTARFTGTPPVIWAVHSTELGPLSSSWKTRIVRRLCAQLSNAVPVSIVSDARSGAALHERIGFSRSKLIVVPNGVDPVAFGPDLASRERVRRSWGVEPDEVLLGCVARWDPLKDHENLLAAIRDLALRGRRFRCALVGRGLNAQNQDLQKLIARWGVAKQLILADASNDVCAVMNALDVHVLSSRSESLPVAVMEAMSCGAPCVVTDVGDAAHIVGNTGWVAPPRDARALADAIAAALDAHQGDGWPERASACRSRVIREFSLARMGAEYSALWAHAANGQSGG